MEEEVLSDGEDLDELLVEGGHHGSTRSALADGNETVNILSRSESFLPELELNSGVKLCEANIEVSLKSLWVADVDGVGLRRVLLSVSEVLSESLAESSELGFSVVGKAELECL